VSNQVDNRMPASAGLWNVMARAEWERERGKTRIGAPGFFSLQFVFCARALASSSQRIGKQRERERLRAGKWSRKINLCGHWLRIQHRPISRNLNLLRLHFRIVCQQRADQRTKYSFLRLACRFFLHSPSLFFCLCLPLGQPLWSKGVFQKTEFLDENRSARTLWKPGALRT
jgi:hypothetical protein